MSEKELVTLRNKTREEHEVRVGDFQEMVGPLSEILLTETETIEALRRYGDFLEIVQTNTIAEEVKDDSTAPIWLANMSGNPDAPEHVNMGLKFNPAAGKPEPVLLPNLLAKPVDFVTRYGLATKPPVEHTQGGKIELAQSTRRFRLAPFERVPVERRIAKIVLGKAEQQKDGKRVIGHVIESRPPSPFEPTKEWSIDEIRAWLMLADMNCELGDSEATIRRNAADEIEAKRALHKAKETLLRRTYFRSADPKYLLPTRSEWERALGREEVQRALGLKSAVADKVVEAQLGSKDEDAELAPKKRGRPRKNVEAR